jgi:signal transduction histidine kinase/ActR/RegA family two-component response regulator
VRPEDARRVEAIIAESLRTPGVIQSVEVQLRQVPDRWRLFELVGKGVVLECGSPIIVFNGRDVTDRRRLEVQLRQTQKIESIGRLAGGIAHDFNNILAAILANCDLLREETAAAPALRAGIDEIAGAAERAASLTQQLLAFSRRQVLQPKVLELNAVVREFEAMLRRLLGSDVEWRFVPDPALGAVAVDRTQMEQVLLNLAANARDAMPEGGCLTIATTNLDVTEPMTREMPGLRAGAYVVLSVRDTGHGMDAATASHVFEPFFTTKETGHGAGLGLATVYGIVKQSGGYIAVDTTLAQGAEFRIFLPRLDQPVASPAPIPADQTVVPKPRGNETILLVEDEPSVRKVTVRLLERLGYRTLVAERPDQALALARDMGQKIDLVISDVVMPLMRGPALVREMIALRPGLKAVLVSGYALDSSEPSVVLEAGVSFLRKPFSIGELGQLVRRQLDEERLP